jgi:hypothetical protein
MSYFQSYCECKHSSHDEGGSGHPFSAKIAEDEAVPCGWSKGAPVVACRACVGAGHIKVTS